MGKIEREGERERLCWGGPLYLVLAYFEPAQAAASKQPKKCPTPFKKSGKFHATHQSPRSRDPSWERYAYNGGGRRGETWVSGSQRGLPISQGLPCGDRCPLYFGGPASLA